jgi:hypothetical protein
MKHVLRALILLSGLCLAALLIGCDSKMPANDVKESNVVNKEIGNLAKLINLPFEPVRVIWETSESPGGRDWSLTAMLEFSPHDFQALLEQSSKLGDVQTQSLASKYLFEWLPSEINSAYITHKGDDFILVDAYKVSPMGFVDPKKSPLVNGDVIVFEAHHIVLLHLFTT